MESQSLPDERRDELIRTIRTVVGDELRSITYFDESTIDQVYLRSDLDADADLVGFAETERLGFHAQTDYKDTELGNYLFTIRVFEDGYLTRVILGDHGVFVTTDTMARTRFEELASALREILQTFQDE